MAPPGASKAALGLLLVGALTCAPATVSAGYTRVAPAVTPVVDTTGTWTLIAAQEYDAGTPWPDTGGVADTVVNPGDPTASNFANIEAILTALPGATNTYEFLLHYPDFPVGQQWNHWSQELSPLDESALASTVEQFTPYTTQLPGGIRPFRGMGPSTLSGTLLDGAWSSYNYYTIGTSGALGGGTFPADYVAGPASHVELYVLTCVSNCARAGPDSGARTPPAISGIHDSTGSWVLLAGEYRCCCVSAVPAILAAAGPRFGLCAAIPADATQSCRIVSPAPPSRSPRPYPPPTDLQPRTAVRAFVGRARAACLTAT